jgi:hypothetical protein
VNRQKPLHRSGRLEPAHSAFSLALGPLAWFCKQTIAGQWMRNFGPSVQPTTCDMKLSQPKFAKRRRIRTQLVGDKFIWNASPLFQEFPHKFLGPHACFDATAPAPQEPRLHRQQTATDMSACRQCGQRLYQDARFLTAERGGIVPWLRSPGRTSKSIGGSVDNLHQCYVPQAFPPRHENSVEGENRARRPVG